MTFVTNSPLVRSEHGVTLIGGGAVTAVDLEQALARAPVLVAADGGANAALALGYRPTAVIGDFDSLSDAARDTLHADVLHHIPEQDSTDFTKCLTRIDAPSVIAVGFAGRRLDHTLGALNVIATQAHMRIILIADEDVCFLCPQELVLDLAEGTRVSLFPFGTCRGTSKGLEWPIDGIEFTPAGRSGTSNRANGQVQLTMQGPMLVLLPRDALDAALAGLHLT